MKWSETDLDNHTTKYPTKHINTHTDTYTCRNIKNISICTENSFKGMRQKFSICKWLHSMACTGFCQGGVFFEGVMLLSGI